MIRAFSSLWPKKLMNKKAGRRTRSASGSAWNPKHYRLWSEHDASASWISSKAARTAAITKAEKVQFLPWIAFSTSSTTSLGKRIVLLIVGGVDGIWNLLIDRSSQYICITISLYHHFSKVCIAFAITLGITIPCYKTTAIGQSVRLEYLIYTALFFPQANPTIWFLARTKWYHSRSVCGLF